MKVQINTSLLMMGDYNEVLIPKERKGGTVLSGSMIEFKNWVDQMNFLELPLTGRKYTRRKGNSCSRIDRVFVQA